MDNKPMNYDRDLVASGLDSLIMTYLRELAMEQYHPGPDPDRMDEKLRDLPKKIAKLRTMRNEFEDLVAGVC